MMPNEPITDAKFSKLATSRDKIYGLLSSIYLKIPDRDFVKKLIDRSFELHLAPLARDTNIPREMRDGVKVVMNFIGRCKGKSFEKVCDELSVEYTRLFRGVKRFYGPPPPYESVYVDQGLVMGDSTIMVKKKYEEAGVGLTEDLKGEPPDHIGFELDFMRHLCNEEADAWKMGGRENALKHLEMESKFLEDHLTKWAPKFCDMVTKNTKLDFYKGMMKITKGFIIFDKEHVDKLIDILKNMK